MRKLFSDSLFLVTIFSLPDEALFFSGWYMKQQTTHTIVFKQTLTVHVCLAVQTLKLFFCNIKIAGGSGYFFYPVLKAIINGPPG
jgi:hypothetical protein